MSIIIDGYNLLHAAGIIGRGVGPGGLERSRLALLNFLVESLPPEQIARTVVVFDAREAPYGAPRTTQHRGLTVRFASKYPDADSLIEELISLDSAPKTLTVVSNDHRLHRAARRRKATPVDADVWFGEVIRQRRERQEQPQPAKPQGTFSEDEVRFWLDQFSQPRDRSPDQIVPAPEDEPLIDDPFPPGYADDIFNEGSDR